MRGSALVLIGGLGMVALSACSQANRSASTSAQVGPGVVKNGSTIVLTSALLHQDNRTLLEILQRRLPNIRVVTTANCPEVYLRGRSSLESASDASIYVNGQRAVNTCVLEILYSFDLESVEVYPMGVTSRPGYVSDADGLILVFMRKGR